MTPLLEALRRQGRGGIPAWIGPMLVAVAPRWPILTLPGPGRDEAAYAWWAHHPEPAYAPLLQVLVRGAEAVGISGLWALRLPAFVLGLLLIVLLDRHWSWLGIGKTGRITALAAVALTPWQNYVGGLLHPDMALMVALVLFVTAATRGHLVGAAAAAGLAIWAKPTGLLLVPVLLALTVLARAEAPSRRFLALGLVLALAAPVLFSLRTPMLREMAAFGQMDGISPVRKALWAGGRLMFQAGWLLPLAGLAGLVQRISGRTASGDATGDMLERRAAERRVVLLVAGLFAVVFGAAALGNGQIKENWILPAAVLLWPLRPVRGARFAPLLLIPGIAGALLQGLFMSHPALADRIEHQGGALIPAYVTSAGTRELRVSPARSWTARMREYQPLDAWATEVGARFAAAGDGDATPDFIVTSDYGLAARLAWEWRAADPRLVIPDDGIFWRTVADAQQRPLTGAGLLLGGGEPPPELGLVRVTPLGTLPDPQSGVPLLVARVEGGASPAGASPPAATSAPATSTAPTTATLPTSTTLPTSPVPPADLHGEFTRLLRNYVTPAGVRYAAWSAAAADHGALDAYVKRLESQDPTAWPRKEALAYWINLYNAVTVRLILDNYPVKSIKDLSGPWTKKRAVVAGEEYSLNDIENEVIRPRFKEPRIHFALNCASIGCPPLRAAAYTGDSLDFQLNANCRVALNSGRYLVIEGSTIRTTKIFDWYAKDFVDAMGVREFISRYVPDNVARKLTDMSYRMRYLNYDWKLNAAP